MCVNIILDYPSLFIQQYVELQTLGEKFHSPPKLSVVQHLNKDKLSGDKWKGKKIHQIMKVKTDVQPQHKLICLHNSPIFAQTAQLLAAYVCTHNNLFE